MSFFQELKERNVVKVGAIYLITGWLVIQVASTVFPQFGIPEWAGRLVTLLIALGFPIALVLAWALELTPEGIKRAESSVGEKRMWTISIALAIAAIAWFELGQQVADEPAQALATKADPNEVSIAVLPFIDLSAERDQEFFALGMSEELLNVLAKIEQLAVASRTSAFAFQGSKLSAQEIGQALEVAFVLEGSIRKAGDTLRITAQLIDAETDRHLWSETYDRSTADIFKVQDEIASAIVDALKAALNIELDGDKASSNVITDNMNAYELFLVGREAFNQRDMNPSIEALERAVDLDPEFAEAWAYLGAAYGVAPGWVVRERPFLELGAEAVNRALVLDDEIAMAHLAKAYILSSQEGRTDYVEVMKYYGRALELDPTEPTVLMWNGMAYMELGYFDRAASLYQTCNEVEPAYFNCWRFAAWMNLMQGDVETAMSQHSAVLDRFFRRESQLAFALGYLFEGNEAAASLILVPVLRYYDIYAPGLLELFKDAAARPRDRDRLVQQLLEVQARGMFDTGTANHLLVGLGRHDLVRMGSQDSPWFWLNFKDYRESGQVYRHLDHGVYEYWDEFGPPDFCKRTGKPGIERYRCDLSRWERK